MVTERKDISEYVKAEKWDDAIDTMMNAEKCFIGEKYTYIDFPEEERWNLESLAADVIHHHDKDGWEALIQIRDRLGELLDVDLR